MQKEIMFDPDNGDSADKKNKAEAKPQEMYTKPTRDGMISYIEREVDRFNYENYEVVRRELFSKANCPAVTFKYGAVNFNIRAIRKLDECNHIQILINSIEKRMLAKPCGEDEKDSVQWCRVDKHGKTVSRKITGRMFTAQLYKEMKWSINMTIKVLGYLVRSKDGEKIYVFDLFDAEAYLRISAPNPDDPNQRERVPYTPSHYTPTHWEDHYGQPYEEHKVEIVKTFEGVPEGFVKIEIPKLPSKKTAGDKTGQNENKETTGDGTV